MLLIGKHSFAVVVLIDKVKFLNVQIYSSFSSFWVNSPRGPVYNKSIKSMYGEIFFLSPHSKLLV